MRWLFVALALPSCPAVQPSPPDAPAATEAGAKARQLVADGARLLDVRTRSEFAGGRSGHRSAIAAKILKDAGFTQVYDLGSIRSW